MSTRTYAKMTVTLEIDCGSSVWNADTSLGQIQKEGRDTGEQLLYRLCTPRDSRDSSAFSVVKIHSCEVRLVCPEEEKK